MKTRMYCVRDAVIDAYKAPVCLLSDAVAKRAFADELAAGRLDYIKRHPQDYSLWCIGTFDDHLGAVISIAPPEMICSFGELNDEMVGTD